MSNAALERAAALVALATGQPVAQGAEEAPRLERTGTTVDAGGDELRLLTIDAPSLGRTVAGVYHRTPAVAGDLVKLTKGEAERLDSIGATVDPDTDAEELAKLDADGLLTDEQIKTGRAEDLVAYVGQHPDERERVRTLEEGRGKKARSTVLDATEPTPDEDQEAADAAAEAERVAAEEAAKGTTPEAEAEAQQGNDGGTGE